MKQKSVLVIFGKELPQKSKKWLGQFDKVLTSKEVSDLTSSGSVQEAYQLLGNLSGLMISDGKKLPKLFTYQGYELWWMNIDAINTKFCLPYTQYRNLLLYLKDFDRICLFQPPWPHLFQYFLKAHNRRCIILKKFCLRDLLPIPFGIIVQALLSVVFLPWMKIRKPQLLVWTSDKFDPPRDHNFRVRYIYEELRQRKLPFAEFIRSMEAWPVVLQHAWARKRPVFYSTAITFLIHFFTNWFSGKNRLAKLCPSLDTEKRFWFFVATHYLHNIRGTILSVRAMKFIIRWLGVKAAYISAGCSRNFYEILGCKLNNIKIVGIQHGLGPRWGFTSGYMPGFDGQKMLSVDKFGLASEWWKEYYASHSSAYKPEQLYISGPMRPIKTELLPKEDHAEKDKLKVLFISEQLAVPTEIMPYLLKLMELKDITLCMKFRPYRDGFEEWLEKHHPNVLKSIKVFKGTTQEAVSQTDVAVGSHSTAVLEALLQFKPFIFFWTKKWGDYFEIKPDTHGRFYADNPEELISCIRNSPKISKEEIKQLQERFFGNPYQNGSKWVVDQLEKFL